MSSGLPSKQKSNAGTAATGREVWKKAGLLWLTLTYYAGSYFIAQRISLALPQHTLTSYLDAALPFIPPFIYLYLQVYLIALLPLVIVDSYQALRRDCLAYVTNLTGTFVVFMIYPTTIIRPVPVVTGFNEFAVALLYRADLPVCCFPSLHVSMAVLASLIVTREHRRLGLACHIATIAVALSTLFLKQHYVADVLGGYAMALVAYGLVNYRSVLTPAWLRIGRTA
ncbi:phosphatase PAP2 family protein [bacterium]|nr:phosphatase PAP2 family protein [candidate division CSSED10-310 bacterium]